MRKPADSIILALANWAAYGAFLLGGAFHLRLANSYGIAVLPIAIALLFLTIFFAVKDFRRRLTRVQALIALALAAPFAYYLLRRW